MRFLRKLLPPVAVALVGGLLAQFVSLAAAALFVAIAALPFVPRPAYRFLAGIFILLAAVAFVSDITPAVTGSGVFAVTSLGDLWVKVGPGSYNAAKAAITGSAAPWLWDGPISHLLGWPTFALFGVLGLLCGYAGRRRHEINIYVN